MIKQMAHVKRHEPFALQDIKWEIVRFQVSVVMKMMTASFWLST
jgi:hypothetical protein